MERKKTPSVSTEFNKDNEVHEELKNEIMNDEKQKRSRQRRKERNAERKSKIEDSKLFTLLSEKVWPILVPFFIVMGFLVVLPLLGIIMYSVIQPTGNSIQFRGTLENFIDLFTNKGIMMALGLSIAYALCASILCVIIGYPIAYIMASLKSKIIAKNIWVLVTMPIWISMLLKVLGLQSLFFLISPTAIGTPIAIIIGMVYMFLPFAITPIYDSIDSRNRDLEEAAKDLGLSGSKTFWTITLRETIPGILTGFSLVIIQAATSLVVVHYLGAGKINLISSIIESYFFKGSNFGYGAAIAVVLTILIFLLMFVIKLISNKFENKGKGRGKWKSSSKAHTSQ